MSLLKQPKEKKIPSEDIIVLDIVFFIMLSNSLITHTLSSTTYSITIYWIFINICSF